MSKSNTFENDLLKLIFTAVGIANIADDAGSSPLENLYLSLHTADPGETGNQSTSEVTYTGYARVAVPRDTDGWTVTNNEAALAENVDFPIGTGGGGTATFFGVGTAASSTGKLLYSGAISPSIVCGEGITPRLTTGTKITED